MQRFFTVMTFFPIVVSAIYYKLNPDLSFQTRVLSSAHGVLFTSAYWFAYGMQFVSYQRADPLGRILFGTWALANLLGVGLLVFGLMRYDGPKWAHLLLFPLIYPSLSGMLFMGSMLVSHAYW